MAAAVEPVSSKLGETRWKHDQIWGAISKIVQQQSELVDRLRREIQQKDDDIQQLVAENDQLRTVNDKVREKCQNLEINNKKSTSQCKRLTKELQQQKNICAEQEKEIASVETFLQSISSEQTAAKEQLAAYIKQLQTKASVAEQASKAAERQTPAASPAASTSQSTTKKSAPSTATVGPATMTQLTQTDYNLIYMSSVGAGPAPPVVRQISPPDAKSKSVDNLLSASPTQLPTPQRRTPTLTRRDSANGAAVVPGTQSLLIQVPFARLWGGDETPAWQLKSFAAPQSTSLGRVGPLSAAGGGPASPPRTVREAPVVAAQRPRDSGAPPLHHIFALFTDPATPELRPPAAANASPSRIHRPAQDSYRRGAAEPSDPGYSSAASTKPSSVKSASGGPSLQAAIDFSDIDQKMQNIERLLESRRRPAASRPPVAGLGTAGRSRPPAHHDVHRSRPSDQAVSKPSAEPRLARPASRLPRTPTMSSIDSQGILWNPAYPSADSCSDPDVTHRHLATRATAPSQTIPRHR